MGPPGGHPDPHVRLRRVVTAEIDSNPFIRPNAVGGPQVTEGGLRLDPTSVTLLNRGTVNNAFTGIVNINTGIVTVYPLADEAYRGGDPTIPSSDPDKPTTADGYMTSRFPRGRPYLDGIGHQGIGDTPARPLAPGARRARSMSMSAIGPPERVAPIKHMDPRWLGKVSHEQLARRTGGIPSHEFNADRPKYQFVAPPSPPRDTYSRFIGFTVWIEPRRLRLVCTSRALNGKKFNNGDGKMSLAWAFAIKKAFDSAGMLGPGTADDLDIPKAHRKNS